MLVLWGVRHRDPEGRHGKRLNSGQNHGSKVLCYDCRVTEETLGELVFLL